MRSLRGGGKRGRRSPHDVEGLEEVVLPPCARALQDMVAGPWSEDKWLAMLISMDAQALADLPATVRGGSMAAKATRMMEKVAEYRAVKDT